MDIGSGRLRHPARRTVGDLANEWLDTVRPKRTVLKFDIRFGGSKSTAGDQVSPSSAAADRVSGSKASASEVTSPRSVHRHGLTAVAYLVSVELTGQLLGPSVNEGRRLAKVHGLPSALPHQLQD